MYSLKEKDLMPGSTCEFEATGETAEEVKSKLMSHAQAEHAEQFGQMTPEQTEATMKRADELLSSQGSAPEAPETPAAPENPAA